MANRGDSDEPGEVGGRLAVPAKACMNWHAVFAEFERRLDHVFEGERTELPEGRAQGVEGGRYAGGEQSLAGD